MPVSEANGFRWRDRRPAVGGDRMASAPRVWCQRQHAPRWRTDGRLYLIHRGVYCLGHPQLPIEGRLVPALLYAGDDAVLSHATAAWWWGLLDDEPHTIEVSACSWVRSCPGVIVRHRGRIDVTRHRRFPITRIPQTLRDYAAAAALIDVRHALAKADYLRLLDPVDVQAACGQGRPGSATLRKALGRHLPRLARTRSWLEREFIPFCEAAGIALPEINVKLEGWTVDALWRRERVVVELDGYGNHSTRGQMERDRREELRLRVAGFLAIRYTRDQVVHEPELVAADLIARLDERRREPDEAQRARARNR
jgi:hypothetical protein